MKAFVHALINSCLDLVAYIIMVANFCIKNQREGVLNDLRFVSLDSYRLIILEIDVKTFTI